MTRHNHVLEVDISMRYEDGTYRLQTFAHSGGERLPTPLVTVTDAESIPDGLRALAEAIERAAKAEFQR